jgi:hypothetical protein
VGFGLNKTQKKTRSTSTAMAVLTALVAHCMHFCRSTAKGVLFDSRETIMTNTLSENDEEQATMFVFDQPLPPSSLDEKFVEVK